MTADEGASALFELAVTIEKLLDRSERRLMQFLSAFQQTEMHTKLVKSKVTPSYPELARRLKITGVVKVLVTVSADRSVKDAKVMGGHPVLVTAAMDAVKKWRFEAGPGESTGVVEFRFGPTQ